VRLASDVGAVAIVTPTHSGRTARLVSSGRPATAVVAISSRVATRRRLALTWGVEAQACPERLPLEEMRTFAQDLICRRPGVKPGSRIVLTAGYPLEGRPTNLVTVVSAERRRGSARRG
jgi:pyruvate kinase